MMRLILSQGWARVRRLVRDARGGIAPMFAVAIVPLIIVAGVGVDMSRGMASRNNLQDALDATGLAIAHLPPSTSLAALQTKANAWLNANLTDANLGPITLTLTRSQGQIVLNATSTVKTTLTGLAGVSTMPVKAATTVKWGLSHVEIALVLDNTGSMAGTKLSTLISAAQDLVDTLDATSDHADPTALKISVVPFSMTVNIGSGNSGTWLTGVRPAQYGGSDSFDTAFDRFQGFAALGKSWAGCVESRPQPYDVQDTAPSTGTPATLFVPFFAPDEPGDGNGYDGGTYLGYPNDYIQDVKQDKYPSPTPTLMEREVFSQKYSTVWGCVNWKNGNCKTYDWTTGTPTVRSGTNSNTGYAYGPNAGCSLTPLLRLTTDINAVKAKLGQMQAIGDTNIPMGLIWGWHTLSPNQPFADGAAYGTTGVKKIVVLLTDGDNTMTGVGGSNINSSYYNGLGYIWQGRLGITSGSSGTRTSTMDSRMALLCSNMKQSDIIIYAVRIDVSGTAPAALSGCASQTEYFYDVPDVADLSQAFEAIAGQIGDLRIAK